MNMNDNDQNNDEIDLSKACALEYAKEDGNDAVAEQAPNVGVNRHLDEQSWKSDIWQYKYKYK